MINKYFVVRMDESSDLYCETYDDYDEATAAIKADENKAILIRCENICTDSFSWPPKLDWVPYT